MDIRLTDIANDPSELNIDDEMRGIQELGHFFFREPIHAWHLNVDILVSYAYGLSKL